MDMVRHHKVTAMFVLMCVGRSLPGKGGAIHHQMSSLGQCRDQDPSRTNASAELTLVCLSDGTPPVPATQQCHDGSKQKTECVELLLYQERCINEMMQLEMSIAERKLLEAANAQPLSLLCF